MEAVIGFAGVLVGAFITWFKEAWSDRRTRERHARYLAICVVCVLDRYVEDSAAVALDDGLCEGQPNEHGCLEPQVRLPLPPAFSHDLDWKSIGHDLMYRLLSLPSEAEAANRMIADAAVHASPPDYDQFFEQRQYHYARLGLKASTLAAEVRIAYRIPAQDLGEWNPVEHLTNVKERVDREREERRRRFAASPSWV